MPAAATKPDAASQTNELFDQAIETFEVAVKTGAKVQEETAQWFVDLMGGLSSPQEWQKKAEAVAKQVIPATQKNLDEALKAMNENARESLDLLKKAFEAGQSESVSEAQAKMYQVWESALASTRANTQAVVQANARVIESYAELLKTGVTKASR